MRGRGIGPCVANRPGTRSLPVIATSVFSRSRVDRASRSSRVTISTSPAPSWSRAAAKLRALGLGSARHFAEHFARPVHPQRRDVSGDALAVGRYPCITVNHRFILHRNCATEKHNPVKGLFLVRNSSFIARQLTHAKSGVAVAIMTGARRFFRISGQESVTY